MPEGQSSQEFKHKGPPWCFHDMIRVLLLRLGYPDPGESFYPSKGLAILKPVLNVVRGFLRGSVTSELVGRGLQARQVRTLEVDYAARIDWLMGEVIQGNLVVILVWSKWCMPMPHWLVVSGWSSRRGFEVYDDRVSAPSDPKISIANTFFSHEKIVGVWRDWLGRRKAFAIVISRE